jgi:hypothetical protein
MHFIFGGIPLFVFPLFIMLIGSYHRGYYVIGRIGYDEGVLSILLVIGAVLIAIGVFLSVLGKLKIKNDELMDSVTNGEKPKQGFCPNCKINISSELTYCPICKRKIK